MSDSASGGLTIRAFHSTDAEAVTALWGDLLPSKQTWNDPTYLIARKLLHADDLFFIGERDGNVVATVMAGYDGVRGWIYSLAVATQFQRQGIGRRLMNHAESALRERGCPKVNLQVLSSNSAVVAFYQSCGFEVEGRVSLGKSLNVEPRQIVDATPTIPINDGLVLAPVSWDDREAFLRYFNESDTFHKMLNRLPKDYRSIDFDHWMTRVSMESLDVPTARRRSWVIRDTNDLALGGIGLFNLHLNQRAELGYWLAQEHWGRGIMTMAVQRLCDFAFQHYGLQKIAAQVLGKNPTSRRVLEKSGFILEGTLRHDFYRDGVSDDTLWFGLLRDDWQQT